MFTKPRRIVLVLLSLFLAATLAACGVNLTKAPAGTPLPNNFQLVEQASFGTSLQIISGQTQYGTVSIGAFSTKSKYEDNSGTTLSYAVPDFHFFSPSSDSLYDASGKLQFTLKDNLYSTAYSTAASELSIYDVYNSQNQLVAVSEKVQNFFTTTFLLSTPNGVPLVQANLLAGGVTSSADIWQVTDEQTSDQVLPKSVIIEILAFKTQADDQAREQANNNSNNN